ncbi:hypothetical protein XENTR_v10002472 [Xenopus tropicalis]|nr:hypothetical protein XENTR_v10002472 [Xenopus tropicalis]
MVSPVYYRRMDDLTSDVKQNMQISKEALSVYKLQLQSYQTCYKHHINKDVWTQAAPFVCATWASKLGTFTSSDRDQRTWTMMKEVKKEPKKPTGIYKTYIITVTLSFLSSLSNINLNV